MTARTRLRSLFALVLGLTMVLGGSLAGSSLAQRPAFITANGFVLQQGSTLPIYRFNAPIVDPADTTAPLAVRFEGIANRQVNTDDYLGLPRFTVVNTQTNALITQYGATGGFYAFGLEGIAPETPVGKVNAELAQRQACLFLLGNNFIAGDGSVLIGGQQPQGVISPNIQSCDFNASTNPPYRTTLIQSATESATGAAQTVVEEVGIVVQVPLYLPLPNGVRVQQINQQPGLPLGGAGGHLSLLFTTTDEGSNAFSLDADVSGLGAMAAPFYSRTFEFVRNGTVADPNAARTAIEARVRATYPNAENINVPDPELLYMVGDAAVPQSGLEPMLNFSGITLTVDGEEVILRDIAAPALEGGENGVGPTVAITAPAAGSSFASGSVVNLAGTIADGAPPYTYEWLNEEETLLAGGTLETPGDVSATTDALGGIGRASEPIATTVILRVTDADGIVREAQQILNPIPRLFLPNIRTGGGTPAAPATTALTPGIAQSSSYSFGIEGVWDYPPAGAGGSDLPGVIPDVNGFRSSMTAFGYSQRFSWTNFAAWEKDWRDCSLGGGDCTYGVDRTDFVYYAGHGGPGGIALGSTQASTWVDGANTRLQTARWVGFASCQTLRVQGYPAGSEPIRRWFNAFQGAHMLLGFNSNMADIAFGGRFADNMRIPTFLGFEFTSLQLSIRQAWVKTAFDMNAGKPAYIYARSASANPVDNKLPKPGTGVMPLPLTSVTSYHWVWWNE